LLGALIQRIELPLSERTARPLFFITIALALAFWWFHLSTSIRTAMASIWPIFIGELGASNQFVGDNILGLIVALNFYSVSKLNLEIINFNKIRKYIKFVASFTFSIYLFHLPVFSFLWGVLGLRSPWLIFALLLLAIAGLGQMTERQLPRFRRLLA